MKTQWITAFLLSTFCGGQMAMAVEPLTANPAPQSAASAPAFAYTPSVVTVPKGTTIQLTMVSVIKSLSSHPGDMIRATVAFPVTVGSQMVIPVGTYVEGVLTEIPAQTRAWHRANVQVHFTRLIFENGYTVSLDAAKIGATLVTPGTGDPSTYEVAEGGIGAFPLGGNFFPATQATTQPPALPRVGPNPVEIVVPVLGVFTGLATALIIHARHVEKNTDYLIYNSGWNFQMVLDSPLIVDLAKAGALVPPPAAN